MLDRKLEKRITELENIVYMQNSTIKELTERNNTAIQQLQGRYGGVSNDLQYLKRQIRDINDELDSNAH